MIRLKQAGGVNSLIMPRVSVLPILILFSVSLFGQAEWPRPNWKKVEAQGCRASGKPTSIVVGKYRALLVPEADPETHDIRCLGFLVDAAQHRSLLLRDWDVSVHQGTGKDLFQDGKPSLVLEGSSGGPHVMYTYVIVDLGEKPVILPPIKNEAPFYFFKDPSNHQFRIMTGDGAFDSFDGACNDCVPLPRVVLKIDHFTLHDVSSQFVDQYDSEIALARAKIAHEDVAKFLVTDFKDAKNVVLEIVFSYLYSGREAQAWRTLNEMWPAGDRARIRNLILETRSRGILSTLHGIQPPTKPATSKR